MLRLPAMRPLFLALALSLSAGATATAASVTVNLNGTLAGFAGPGDFAANAPVGVGAPMTATWVYDSNAPSIPFGSPPDVLFINPTLSFSVNVGAGALVMSYNGSTGGLTVQSALSFTGSIGVTDHDFNGLTGSITGTQFAAAMPPSTNGLWDPVQASLSGDNLFNIGTLPLTLVNPSIALGYDTLIGPNSRTGGSIYFSTTSYTVTVTGQEVPIPPAIALLGSVIVGLGIFDRRRRRSDVSA